MKSTIYRKHNGQHTGTKPVRPVHNSICRLIRLSLLTLGITTTAVGQDTIFLNQSNFVYLLNNSNPSISGGSFRVVEDITLPASWIWTPIGTADNPASLNFNGSYHAISGLNATTTGNNIPTGLFGYLVDSWVHHVLLDQPFVLSHGNGSEAGAIAGRILGTNIMDNLVTGGSVETRGSFRSYAGGLTGSADSSRIEDNLNNATVHTIGWHCYAGGATGFQSGSSTTIGNLNTGAVRTNGTYAHAGGVTGYQDHSTTSGNLNTRMVRTTGYGANAGGATGSQSNSTTSDNLNTGAICTNGAYASAGGVTGSQSDSATTIGNLNTGAVRTNGTHAYSGGVTGYQFRSTTSSNLNTGALRTMAGSARAGGVTGYQSRSTTSGNLNTGAVCTMGDSARAGGVMGYQSRSTTSGNLNTGSIRTNGTYAHAGGVTGYQWNSTTSGNLNTGATHTYGAYANVGGAAGGQSGGTAIGNLNSGSVTATLGIVIEAGLVPITRVGLGDLDGMLWTSGDDSQFPMLTGINAAYRDLQRINGTRYGSNTFPVELDEFADPGGSMNASLFDQAIWNACCGYLPFLRAIGRDGAEAVGIDCCEGGFACDCDPEADCPEPTATPYADPGCLFASQSAGTVRYLLYGGQRYHGVVRATVSGLAYWAAYEDGQRVTLGPCGVYGLTDLSPRGVVVDAAVSDGDTAYVAYRALKPLEQPLMLAVFTLSGQQLESSSPLGLNRVAGLSIDAGDGYVLVNTGQGVCRLPVADAEGWLPDCDSGLTGQGEEIMSVAGNGGDLYLLTYEAKVGYRVRTVLGIGLRAVFGVTTDGTGQGEIPPTLRVIGQHLHLLLAEQGLIIWRQYPLDALPVMFSDLWESEVSTSIPGDITPVALSLIPEAGQGQVFVLGHEAGQPRYIQLKAADFVSTTEASTITTEASATADYQSWWAGVGIAGFVVGAVSLEVLIFVARKVYTHFRPEAKDEGHIYERLRARARMQDI